MSGRDEGIHRGLPRQHIPLRCSTISWAQILVSQSKGTEAIAAYEEFVTKRPKDERGTPDALLKLSALWKGYTESQGPYLAIGEDKRAEWNKGLQKSIAAAEQLVTNFPESQQVAKALNTLMEVQRLQQQVKIKNRSGR